MDFFNGCRKRDVDSTSLGLRQLSKTITKSEGSLSLTLTNKDRRVVYRYFDLSKVKVIDKSKFERHGRWEENFPNEIWALSFRPLVVSRIRTGSTHRASLESAGPQNSCDRLNALGENQLPPDSHSAWKFHAPACMPLHACTHQFHWGSWLSPNSFKRSQKTQSTEKGARSLEKLYGSTLQDL